MGHRHREAIHNELCLLFGTQRAECWQARSRAWRDHVTTFACIQCRILPDGQADPGNRWGDARITFITERLNIVDNKFNSLLIFQGFLATSVIFLLSLVPTAHPIWDSWWLRAAVGLLVLLWFSSTVLCLFGVVGRVVWGNLGGSENDCNAAEQEHVDELIEEVIRRTAKFRVAARLTSWSIWLLLGAAIVAAYKTLW